MSGLYELDGSYRVSVVGERLSTIPPTGLPDGTGSNVASTFTSATQSAVFKPVLGRIFNIFIWGTFSGSVRGTFPLLASDVMRRG